MSLLLLIDGYNVLAPVAPPRAPDPRWLQRERMQLIQRLADHLDESTRCRTCVVFDAANPPANRASEYQQNGIEVRFAVDYPEADDLLEELIVAHSAPKTLAVVSSDHRVQAAAKRRGCRWFDSQRWLDNLLDSKVGLAAPSPGRDGAGQGSQENEKPDQKNDQDDVAEWMRKFGF